MPMETTRSQAQLQECFFSPLISIEADLLLNSLSYHAFEFLRSVRFDSKKSSVSNTSTSADAWISTPPGAKRFTEWLCLAGCGTLYLCESIQAISGSLLAKESLPVKTR